MKITDYTIVPGEGPIQLKERVQYCMTMGWQPIGGVMQETISPNCWWQAMVKYGNNT